MIETKIIGGVIKYKEENRYILAPIYDCGNCFYGKTSDERIKQILEDDKRLFSSAINGITAYEDDEGNAIRANQILLIDNQDLKQSIERVKKLINDNFVKIINLINEIPNTYNGVDIMSEIRKEYYIKTLKIRLDNLLF